MPDLVVGTNSYVSVEDADEYMNARLYADAWKSVENTETKAQALIMATRAIDRLRLVGRPVDIEQPLAFPRTVFGRDQENTPQAVVDATCEEALALLDSDLEFRRNLRNYGVTSAAIGNAREGFANRGSRGGPIDPKALRSVEARELMRMHIAGSVPIR